jgi:hypothetical protein
MLKLDSLIVDQTSAKSNKYFVRRATEKNQGYSSAAVFSKNTAANKYPWMKYREKTAEPDLSLACGLRKIGQLGELLTQGRVERLIERHQLRIGRRVGAGRAAAC